MKLSRVIIFASLTASLCVGCAPSDSGGQEDNPDDPGAGEVISAAADEITSGELSTLLMGKSLPVTQGYAPNGVHAGIDFGSTGDGITSVSSPIAGTIVANTSACGKVAIFDGSNTLIFAHMTARTALAVGSQVSVGTYLGKASQVVGGGCVASGPHLHMEIRTGNNPVMAAPANNNTATTLNPLTYAYGPFPPVALVSPAAGAFSASNPVTFTWSPIQGATSYRLQISTQNNFDANTCIGGCVFNNTTAGTQLSVNLAAGSAYYWRVRAGSGYSGGLFSQPRKLQK